MQSKGKLICSQAEANSKTMRAAALTFSFGILLALRKQNLWRILRRLLYVHTEGSFPPAKKRGHKKV
jgi:hypothetical protein